MVAQYAAEALSLIVWLSRLDPLPALEQQQQQQDASLPSHVCDMFSFVAVMLNTCLNPIEWRTYIHGGAPVRAISTPVTDVAGGKQIMANWFCMWAWRAQG